MCGVAGFYSNLLSRDDLSKMTRTLAHRGPDAEGCFWEEKSNLGLGHRRLSILDLSEGANQPFYSSCRNFVMVYNGEVYNYKEIAEKYNIVTKTTSDSEVILECFAKNGVNCIEEFNGMYALAIWDKREAKLYLFRDKLGIKPLFYYQKDGIFAFGSELKAIASLPIPLKLNKRGIREFLHLGYFVQPSTIYENCFKFPSGHYGVYTQETLTLNEFWAAEKKITKEVVTNEKEAKQQLSELLTQSVKKRLISDVPLGTFLSGGVDSSLVTAIAQKLSDKPIKTFSIGFKEAKFNELGYAKQVANHLGTDHHEYVVTEQDALDKVDNLLKIYDEPFADSSAFPTLVVSDMARKQVTVCLSGDGGDELFLGYNMYNWAQRLSNPIIANLRGPLSWALKKFGNDRLRRGSLVLDYPKKSTLKSHLFSQEQYLFSRQEINHLMKNSNLTGLDIIEQFDTLRALNPVEAQALFDIKNYLRDDLLVKVDRASMQYGLEVRVPLLDANLVEFALNLDFKLKWKNGDNKYLLKQVLYDYVPKEIFDRPKWGFGSPLEKWLKEDLKYLIDKYLAVDIIEEQDIFDYLYVKKLIKEFQAGRSYLFYRIWVLILVTRWISENNAQENNLQAISNYH